MDRVDAIRARLDGMDTVLPKTADDLRWLLAEIEGLRALVADAITGVDQQRQRAEQAEAERDALAAKVARVEALAEEWSLTQFPDAATAATMRLDLRAALAGEEGAT